MAPEVEAPQRVFIVGGPGSGKTTLATEVGRRLNIAVSSLDDVARVGGGAGPERAPQERDDMVQAILAADRWIAEGVHLGWTEPLIDAADVVVWLDNVGWQRSSARIARRFMSQAIAEARQRRGRDRFLRFRDYGHRLRELAAALPETLVYDRRRGSNAQDGAGSPVTRAQIESALTGYKGRVVRCRTEADLRSFLESLG